MYSTPVPAVPPGGVPKVPFAVDEIIEEAYERIGLQSVSGYQLKTARRSLNVMFQEWGNRGLHYWEVGDTNIDLIEGQAEYTFYRASGDGTSSVTVGGTSGSSTYGIADILEATYRTNRTATTQADSTLTKIDRSQYSQTPNKLTQGTPSQYYAQRKLNPSIFLYTTPSASVSDATTPSNYQFCFYYMARIQDTGAYTNTADVVNRFYPCMMSGLAYYLSLKFDPERTPALERTYESEMLRALDADNQGTSSFISPQTFYGDGV